MKQTHVVFPYASAPAGQAQPKLPACRAWRIIPRPVADFETTNPAVAAGKVPQRKAHTHNGVFPVWVRLTDPKTGGERGGLLAVLDDGWNTQPTGRDWRIEHVSSQAVIQGNDIRYAFLVETVDDLDECGQVNRPTPRELLYDSGAVAGNVAIATPILDLTGIRDLLFIIGNTGGPVVRNFYEEVYDEDGLTSLVPATLLRAVAGGAYEFGAYGPGANATGSAFAVARLPPSRAKYTLGPDGTGTTIGRVTIIGR